MALTKLTELHTLREDLVKQREEIDKKIEAIDTVLKLFEKPKEEVTAEKTVEDEGSNHVLSGKPKSIKLSEAEKAIRKKESMRKWLEKKKALKEPKPRLVNLYDKEPVEIPEENHRSTMDEPIGAIKSSFTLKGKRLA
jgi:hypothetical protein